MNNPSIERLKIKLSLPFDNCCESTPDEAMISSIHSKLKHISLARRNDITFFIFLLMIKGFLADAN